MRIVKFVVFSAALLAVTPAIGAAQDRPLHFNIGGGPTFIMGDLADRFEMGWGPALGITYDVNERVGVQFEYAYRWFGIPDEVGHHRRRDFRRTTRRMSSRSTWLPT